MKALKENNESKMKLCNLYLTKYIYISNEKFELLEDLDRQIKTVREEKK